MASRAEAGAPRRVTQAGLVAVLVATSAVVAYLAVSLVLTLIGIGNGVSVAACLANQTPGHVTGPPLQPPAPLLDPPVLHWSGLVLVACVAGFFGGNLWGRRRAAAQTRPDGSLGPPSTGLQLLLIAFFLAGIAALGWETFALARVQDQPNLWPITFFVRCANDVLGLPTLIGAVLVCTMVGHWLGYQARAGEPD